MSPGRFDRKMCSISVEPMPSTMSQPKRALKRSPISRGKRLAGRRAEPQRDLAPFWQIRRGEHPGVAGRRAEEDGHLLFGPALEDGRRGRPFRHQHGRRADAERNVSALPRP
jgi:hypothetical protein